MAHSPDPATADLPAPSGNGHVPGGADGPAPRPPGPSARPAAVVLGIVFVLFVIGAVAAGLTGSSSRTPPASPSTAVVPGTSGLVAVPARTALTPILTTGEPPADVVAALVVPRGTAAVPGSATERGVGLYDATVHVQLPAPEEAVITFFRAELAAGHWHVLRAGTTAGGYQFLAQHPGSDGYEWELGVTLSPTTFTSAVPGVTAPATGVTPAALRLFAVSDQS